MNSEFVRNYKKQFTQARAHLFTPDAVRSDPRGAVRAFSRAVDTMLSDVLSKSFDNRAIEICLVALGGYGREELCPYSDIDLLIIRPEGSSEHIAALVRSLWDMGLPLGCVVRSIRECLHILGGDLATDTALLEARFIAGSRQLFRKLEHQVIHRYFMKRRSWFISEQTKALRNSIFSPDSLLYVVEPDIKNGICMLRDCQRIRWANQVKLRKFDVPGEFEHLSFEEPGKTRLDSAYKSLLGIRCALHVIDDRRIDILEISAQSQVAELLGYGKDGAGALMETLFKTARTIKQAVLLFLEFTSDNRSIAGRFRWYLSSVSVSEHIRLLDGILYKNGVVPPPGADTPLWILELFWISFLYQATMSVELRNLIRGIMNELTKFDFESAAANKLFRRILSADGKVEPVLNCMYETGVLGALVPEFEALCCKVEYDTYHEYTVDQHILRGQSWIDNAANDDDPSIATLYRLLPNRFLLRLALLLHDIGKALPGGDHPYRGAIIVEEICARLGLNDTEIHQAALLVRYHLELSKLTFQREPEKQILFEFSARIENVRNLDMLYLLTIFDIKSVGRKTWTAWKGMQLAAVYERARNMLAALERDSFSGMSVPLLANETAELTRRNDLLSRIHTSEDLFLHHEPFVGFDRLSVCALDRPHFFADIAGCLSSEGYNILSAQITTVDNKVYDIFMIEPDETTSIPSHKRIANVKLKWKKIVSGETSIEELINKRQALYPTRPRRLLTSQETLVILDNTISPNFTILQIETPDRFGLLYRTARCLVSFDVSIISAKLSTRVARAIDIFYITDRNGHKIDDPIQREKIKMALLEQLL